MEDKKLQNTPYNQAVSLINQALDVLRNSSGDQQTGSSCTNFNTPNAASTPSNIHPTASSISSKTPTISPTQNPTEMSKLFPFFGSRTRVTNVRQRNSPYM